MKASHINMVEEFVKGTAKGFSDIYELYYARVRLFAFKLLNNSEDAKDIAMTSFVKLFERYEHFTTEEGIRAFLFVATRNACFDLLKRKQTAAINRDALLYLQKQEYESLELDMIEAEYTHIIYKAIEQLPPERKKVFKMLYIQGLPIAEVAQRLQLSIKTVKNYRGLAIENIRAIIGHPLILFCLLHASQI